jgi:hypothetical protein
MSEATQRNWQDFAEAIILQAVSDYRHARYRNIKRPYQKSTQREIREIEEFFHSAWFGTLCSLDGAQLLRDLNKQMGLEAER